MRYLLLLVLLSGCDHWEEEHNAKCASWLSRAHTDTDSMNVEMQCTTQKAAHDAEVMSAIGVGVSASRR